MSASISSASSAVKNNDTSLSANWREDCDRIYRLQQAARWRLATTTAAERIAKLKKLHAAIWARRPELHAAIYKDFRKNPSEVDLTEIHLVLSEITDIIKHLKSWMKPHHVAAPLTLFGTRSEIVYEPKGVVLILSPWNYPFQLSMAPVAAAIAAGNCVILKPSSKTAHTAVFLKTLLGDVFPEEEIAVIEGGPEVADYLLEMKFDHIFFTGSPPVGKKIMAAAAKHLTPVTLELGGKSPVIVDETADVEKAASRILWGKFINAGQTCVAPDYVMIHESQKEKFVEAARKVIAARYGAADVDREKSPDYCRLVTQQHLEGLKKILDESVRQGAKIAFGGQTDPAARYFAPTLVTDVTKDSALMREEIFGPILPLVAYRDLDQAIALIQSREKPLALYMFSRNDKNVDKVLRETTSGGACVNTLMLHLANPELPFGGVGQSGMGNYHGFFGFKTLSHERGVLRQGPLETIKMFYPPYTPKVKKMIELVMKWLG